MFIVCETKLYSPQAIFFEILGEKKRKMVFSYEILISPSQWGFFRGRSTSCIFEKFLNIPRYDEFCGSFNGHMWAISGSYELLKTNLMVPFNSSCQKTYITIPSMLKLDKFKIFHFIVLGVII